MVRASLPPGFRFHPTDVELILYYLKRKIMGRKFTYEAIAEVNIYKHSPWDLPDKSCLKSKDLEWFFFCPRERKYASGVRVKRATENGYWKTTGKDRNITCNGKTVGTIKTLIFHLGHAPQGERTDWVIHEYRILDDQLAKDGVQDNYVICKVFKKNGLGPNNGAQYGAPFSEADWADDDEDVNQNCSISLAAEGSFSAGLMQNEEQSLPLGSALSGFGNGSPHILEGGPSSSAIVPTTVVAEDKTADGFACLLASFLDEDMPLSNENKLDQGDPSEHGRNKLASSSEGLDLYNGLHDLDSCTTMNEGGFEFSEMQNTDNCLNSMLPKDNSTYIELDDLLPSLDCSDGVAGTPLSSLWQAPASYSHDNMQQLYSGTSITGIDQYTSYTNELAVPPYTSEGDIFLDGLQMMDHQFYQGDNSEFPFSQSEAVYSPHNMMERGSDLENYYSRIMEWIPGELGSATAVAFGGSSIHIKAEVTGVCTDEALSLMMEGSNTSWCCCYFLLTKYTYSLMLLNLVQVFSALIMVWSYHYKHLNENFTHKVHLLLCLKLHLHVLLSY